MSVSFDVDAKLVAAYIFYTTILMVKVLLMAPLTARHRFKTLSFSNPEDAKISAGAKVKFDNPEVERVRRAHLNDLENCLPYALIGLFYILINPTYNIAVWHFRVFTIARIVHTILYLGQVPQPARAAAFGVGQFVCVSMAVQILMNCCS